LSADYAVAPAALDDIDEIAEWNREQSPGTDMDLRFIDAIYEAFEVLARQPGIGHKRQDLTDQPVLSWTVMKSFAVIYRHRPPVEIVHVMRWSRDIPALLGKETS
jgi:toxin ParE1/3/4